MNPSKVSIGTALDAWNALLNGGSMVGLSGTRPVSVETALSGNTTLVTATLAATAFPASTYNGTDAAMEAAASFSAANFTPAANGACTFFRAYKSDGTTAVADLSVGQVHADNNVTAVGQYCTNAGNTYQCTTAGTTGTGTPPTGTGTSITDGTVVWKYIGAGQQFDVLLGNCNIQTGVPCSPSATSKMPVPNNV